MADKTETDRPPARGSGQRVAEGSGAKGRTRTRVGATGKAKPHAGESSAADDVERTRDGVELERRDDGSATNSSTPSQQPTMLESRGGLEQPHPTMAPRAARSSRQAPPVGRSHDSSLDRDATADAPSGVIRVRATQLGYYRYIRRREGDVFDLVPIKNARVQQYVLEDPDDPESDRKLNPSTNLPIVETVTRDLTAEEQFSEVWMERVDANEKERVTTARDAIRKAHDEILGGRTVDRDVTA